MLSVEGLRALLANIHRPSGEYLAPEGPDPPTWYQDLFVSLLIGFHIVWIRQLMYTAHLLNGANATQVFIG